MTNFSKQRKLYKLYPNSYKGFRWHYVELNSDKLVLKGKYIIKI